MKSFKRGIIVLITIGVIALTAALATGCSSAPKAVVLDGADKDAVLAFSEPAADNLLTGLNAGDYVSFSRDFDDAMLKAIDEKGFANLQSSIMPKIGKYLSRTVTSVEEVGEFYRLTYRGNFELDANVKVLLTFEKAEPHKVGGLFFTSDKLK